MSEVIGDISHLHSNTVPFSAVFELIGSSGSFAHPLVKAEGFKHLLVARASVRVVDGTLTCKVVGPISASKAVSVLVAIVPHNEDNLYPTTARQVLTVGGNAFVQHSVYVKPEAVAVEFAPEVAHQLKPKPVVGELPCVVGHFTITGGTSTDIAYLTVAGRLAVDGVGFAQSWSS